MTIFKEKLDEEYLTIAETKEILEDIEVERAADDDREMRYELARAIEHVNRFAVLSPGGVRPVYRRTARTRQGRRTNGVQNRRTFVPVDRSELRSLYAQERYSLSQEELDEILNIVRQHA
ncbi:MAG: DNA-directed RNA polymerase, subunit F [halophilic archaeon J07HX64]|jgi:DNA-directed RNA polymerase, subunit F (EC 2.7.7.6)|nr:MAG: DNA-directed RNA polymerase, subunit F [halophilic archaeon J07HX64]